MLSQRLFACIKSEKISITPASIKTNAKFISINLTLLGKGQFMKTLLSLALLLSCQMTFASSLEGTYKVVKSCKPNSIRLSPLIMMAEQGLELNIKIDQENNAILFTNRYEESIDWPLTSDNNFEPLFFKNFFKNAKVQLSDDSYAFTTKGTELKKCYPFPVSPLCLEKWNDGMLLEVKNKTNVIVQWKIDDTKGTCELERL